MIMLSSLCHAPMCTLSDLHSGGLCVPGYIRVVVALVPMHVLGEDQTRVSNEAGSDLASATTFVCGRDALAAGRREPVLAV